MEIGKSYIAAFSPSSPQHLCFRRSTYLSLSSSVVGALRVVPLEALPALTLYPVCFSASTAPLLRPHRKALRLQPTLTFGS